MKKNSLKNIYVLALLITLLLNGCSFNQHCIRTEMQYVTVQKCLRYSDTGHCAWWGSGHRMQEVCVEWACNEGYHRNDEGKCVK